VAEAKPVEILENAVDKFGPAPTGIEILDPQQELPAAGPGQGMT
jgi:hypothetical protein